MLPAIETIYALATAAGRAGIAIVRVSGPQAFESLRILCGDMSLPQARYARLMTLKHPETGYIIDESVIILFHAPYSYTGENVVEYHIHGGKAVRDSLFDALSKCAGHRMAEPGEYTRRAFENGRMDLTQAEAVADLIHAETEAQKQLALSQMGGALTCLYQNWTDSLVQALAYAEAQIDFSEDDLPEEEIKNFITPVLYAVSREIEMHLNDGNRGERLRDGIKIVVIGAPNSGKSSLVNALTQRDVAIVSDMAGTTRDLLEVHLDLGGFPVILYDTAGLRPEALSRKQAQDRIEAEGIRRALNIAEAADFKILLFDATESVPHKNTLDLFDNNSVLVANKTDKGINDNFAEMIPVSAKTGKGLSELIMRLTNHVRNKFETQTLSPSLTRARHREALTDTSSHLDRALHSNSPDMMAEDIRLAVRSLGRITGKTDVEDLLDVIFRDFCIGK